MNRITIAAALLALASCTQAQRDTAADYQTKIAAACRTAMLVAPFAPTVAPWIIGGCAGEAAVAKLALDPSSLDWIEGLIAKAKL